MTEQEATLADVQHAQGCTVGAPCCEGCYCAAVVGGTTRSAENERLRQELAEMQDEIDTLRRLLGLSLAPLTA